MNIDQLIREADPAAGTTVPGPDSPVARQSFERVMAAAQTPSRIRHPALAILVTKQRRWLSGVRAKALIGTAVAAAGAAAAAIVVALIPKTPAPPTMAPAPANLTAATVLDQAAQAAGSRTGWPNAQYWYSESQYRCDGQLYTTKVWLSRHGNGVVEKRGPKNGPFSCSGGLITVPILSDNVFGPYTWSQVYTLPTDPAKLKSKLIADFKATQQSLFEDVEDLLTSTPAPPAVLEALFKVDASIPGVKVIGSYTDALGRTGTALQLGRTTIVVDPATGAVLDQTYPGIDTIMYITQGPVTAEPKPAKWVW
jgi:hypothetical protein